MTNFTRGDWRAHSITVTPSFNVTNANYYNALNIFQAPDTAKIAWLCELQVISCFLLQILL